MARPSRQIDQALLASGRALLPAAGCAGLSVRALAEHAGVAAGMFHYHFGSKERFLRALLADIYERMFASLSHDAAQPGTALARLHAALRALARFARTHRRLLARLWADALDGHAAAQEFFASHAPRHIALVSGLVAQAQAARQLRAMPPLSAIAFLMGSIALPVIFVGGLVDGGLVPPGGKAAFEAQALSEAATEQRIELALAALREPSARARSKAR
jgi:AcrR family transcriptional regulator